MVYLLHGFANNHAQWTGYTNVELYAEERRIAIVNISAENKAYAAIGADVTWKEVPGFGYEWRFWNQQVEAFLDWLPREDVYAKMGKHSC